MNKAIRRTVIFLLLAFLLPIGASTLWWATVVERPGNWRAADWGPSGVLPPATQDRQARIHILAARTGGMKGAVSVHSWIVWKKGGDLRWTRYDVVGWGTPVRRDAYAPDANWYSNAPQILATVSGAAATQTIPLIEAAIETYPHRDREDYVIWPGPNSNTFVAYLIRTVPGLSATLPPHAVGKDWLGPGLRRTRDVHGDWHLSWNGWAGLSLGPRTGVEVHLLGQSLGLDVTRPALKLPGVGRLGV